MLFELRVLKIAINMNVISNNNIKNKLIHNNESLYTISKTIGILVDNLIAYLLQ